MKNLSVSTKLLLGFGIACVLMLVFGVVTLITSITRNDDLEYIDKLTDYQADVRDVNVNVLTARIELRTVYTSSFDNDDALSIANDYLSKVKVNLDDALTVSKNELKGEYDANVAVMSKALTELNAALIEVHSSDLKIRELSGYMATEGDDISTAASSFVDYLGDNQQEAFATISSRVQNPDYDISGDIQTYTRRTSFVAMGTTISANLQNLRLNGRALVLVQDLSVVPTIESLLADLDQEITDFYEATQTERTREQLDMLRVVLADYKTAADAIVAEKQNNDAIVVTAREIADVLLAEAEKDLVDIDNTVTNTLATTTSTSLLITYILVILIGFAIVVSVIFGFYIGKSITNPLKLMVRLMTQAGETGNLIFSTDEVNSIVKVSENKDEVGLAAKAYVTLIRQVRYYSEKVTSVANRDLTISVDTLGKADTIGNALVAMIDELSEMVSEIQSSSKQVMTGASQIADGSQSLAQGSTEQAAAVEQLSSSINEVSVKTQDNAKLANKAATLSSTIRDSANRGTEQMDQMMQAMREINEASNNINSVIKVIDNIAFQTNILALNAAVEAARAGSAGKGFAVVAEEVRSLAAKSADAAKETGEMIENSLEKAQLGVRIADDTSASLAEIVNGVNESADIINEIAQSSDEQSSAIKQINIGVDQVAQVVQQNSATAEESAAAAEEMSGQSSIMNELVGRFKVKEGAAISYAPKVALPKGYDEPVPEPVTQSSQTYDVSDDNFGKY